jgi:hypothetical protein
VQHFLPQDISHSGNQTDLRNRKRDGILVMRTDVEFSSEFDEFREQFDDVVDMDTLIEDYCDFYVKDLSERLDWHWQCSFASSVHYPRTPQPHVWK